MLQSVAPTRFYGALRRPASPVGLRAPIIILFSDTDLLVLRWGGHIVLDVGAVRGHTLSELQLQIQLDANVWHQIDGQGANNRPVTVLLLVPNPIAPIQFTGIELIAPSGTPALGLGPAVTAAMRAQQETKKALIRGTLPQEGCERAVWDGAAKIKIRAMFVVKNQ